MVPGLHIDNSQHSVSFESLHELSWGLQCYMLNILICNHNLVLCFLLSWQVYDTPPSGRWQRPVPTALGGDDSIYDTPRSVPPQVDSETEVRITLLFAFPAELQIDLLMSSRSEYPLRFI